MYTELCEQHLQSGSLGRGWNGKGGGVKMEREAMGVCVFVGGGFLCGREKVAERAHRRRGGVYVCVHWSVCVCVCSAAVTSGEGG